MSRQHEIIHIDKNERWIFLSDESFGPCDSEPFVSLLQSIATQTSGRITAVGNVQYRISNLPIDLIFQWDDLFGTVVIYGETHSPNEAVSFLEMYL